MESVLRPFVEPVVITKSPTHGEFVAFARLLLVLQEDALCGRLLARLDPKKLAILGLVLSVSATSEFATVAQEWELSGPYVLATIVTHFF